MSKSPMSKRAREEAGMPSRPLSAYNLYFRDQRKLILEERAHGEGSTNEGGEPLFSSMAKTIAKRWKSISKEESAKYMAAADADSQRYRQEMHQFERSNAQRRAEPGLKELQTVSAGSATAAATNAQTMTAILQDPAYQVYMSKVEAELAFMTYEDALQFALSPPPPEPDSTWGLLALIKRHQVVGALLRQQEMLHQQRLFQASYQ